MLSGWGDVALKLCPNRGKETVSAISLAFVTVFLSINKELGVLLFLFFFRIGNIMNALRDSSRA